jgi:HSP20 family protein
MYLIPQRNEGGLGTLQRQMNHLFDDFFGEERLPSAWGRTGWAPALDVSENEEELLISAEVPGIARENLELSVTGNQLTLTGVKKSESDAEGANVHRAERSWGRFVRTVTLPGTVDPSSEVKAGLKDGVLTIRLAKRPEAKPRSIQVQVD